jgi:hypothetical protein
VITTCWAQHTEGGFWFANENWWDPLSGIWYYDERSRKGFPYIRVGDLRRFYLDGGYFYFHDRYDNHIFKVDAETRQVIWKVPTIQTAGTFEVALRDELIFASGEAGYILVLDRDGRVLAEREFPVRTWGPQATLSREVAFVSGDQELRVWNSSLTAGEAVPLPLAKGLLNFTYEQGEGRMRAVTNWTDYAEDRDIVYVQTFWGEIFRYHVKRGEWLSPLRTAPFMRSIAVDSQNGLLFALNYFQGYMDVMDLDSGEHVAYILANALARFINLDPIRMKGVVNTHGYGMCWFDYSSIVRHRGPRGSVQVAHLTES